MRIKHLVAFLFIATAMLLAPSRAFAQAAGSEAEVIKKANELFEKEDYPAAMPLYSQLLANHRDDPNYNYRYGVCVLYASSEKDKGLPFLEKASKSPDVESDVWFYLGKAYHLNYRFEQAITAYTKYKSIAGAKKAEKLQVDNQIAMCRTGRKLLKAITDITVLDRAELDRSDFFRHYDLKGSGYSGQLLVKPDEFKTSLDKKKNEQSIIFLSGEKTELYFASYGEDETQGKDIYVVRKLPNGTWGKPQNVGYPINTEYDEDYPFLHPNGKVLYFSSKGHNSMGGYDIFRAELNEETNTWQKPVNLDFAINSPDDDIMFVSDLDEKTAWFASNRSSPEGKMTVYHVVIERKPVNMCLIAGNYSPTKNDPNRAAKITVKNAETNEPIGVYKSNEKTGAYLISLPNNGGKYTFTVDHSGIATQTENVFIPPQYSIKTLNQQIGYNETASDTKLFIITDFDTDSSMLDPSFLKDKAKLDINNSEPEMTTVTDIGHTSGALPEAGGTDSSAGNETDSSDTAVDPAAHVPSSKSGVTSEELVKTANDYAQDTQDDATKLSEQSKRAFSYAADLNQQAKNKMQEANDAKTAANALPEGPAKIGAQHKADSLQSIANTLQTQTVAATDMATALEHDTKQKQLEADKAKQYAANIDKAVKANDQKALDAASSEEKELEAMSATRPESGETAKNLQEEADKKHKELAKAQSESNDLKEEIAGNETRIAQLKADQAKEKDPDMKQQIDQQIEGINEDIADDKKQLAAADAKTNRLQNQVNELDNQAKASAEALAQSKNPSIAPVAMNDADKKALGTDVQGYQRSISDGTDTRTYTPVASTQGVASAQGGTTASVVPDTQTQASTQTSGTQTPDTQTQASTQTSGTQTPDTQTQASTQTSGTQTPDTQTQGVEDTSGTVESENPDAQYASALQSTDTISNPVAREKAKAEVYNNWAANIDDQIKEKKQELAGTSDKAKKAALNDEIKKLQASQKEKQNDSKQSLAAADKAQKANAGTPAQPLAVSTDAQFEKQLAAADQQGTIAEKENAKADVYSDWADTLDAQAAAKEKALPKIRSKADQDKAKQEIAALKAEAGQKRNLADEAKTNATAAETAGTRPASSGTQGTSTTTASQEPVYDAPEARTALSSKKAVEATADAHRNSMDSLTALAADAQGAEKTKLLAQANDEQRQAWATDAQAANLQAQANKAQFDKNVEQLSPYDGAGVNSSDSLVLKAEHLSQDAKSLFLLSDEDRAAAANAKDNYTRSESLRKAEEEEAKAIQKQQEAFAAYKASGIKPLATSVASAQTSGTQTPDTQTQASTQTSGTQTPDTQTQSSTQTSGTQTPDTQTQSSTQTSGTQTLDTQTQSSTQTSGTQTPDTQTQSSTQTSGTQTPDTQTQSQSSTQTSGTQTPDTQTQGSVEDTSGAGVENENPDAQYASALQNTDTISNPVAREKAKAAVYNDWSANIGKQISEKKEELALTKDKNKKAELGNEIKKLQASQKEKQNDSKQSLAAADKAQKANAGTPAQPLAVSSDAQFEKQLAAADQQGTTAEKENAKADVYSDWADTLDAQAAAKEKALPKIRSKADQDKAKQEIAALKAEAEQKRNLADAAKTNATAAETATTQPVSSGTQGTQSSGTDPETQSSTPAVLATSITNPSTGQPFSEQQLSQLRETEAYQTFAPLNADAVKSEQRLAELKTQADNFQAQADANVAKAQDLSVAASDEKDVSKKQQLLQESKKYNDAAKANMVSRDSVNGLSESVAYDAKTKRAKADLALQNLDNPTKEQVRAVANADLPASNSSARTGNPVASGTQGATPVSSGTQGTTPTSSGTQGTNPVASGTQGTTPASSGTQGTNPVASGTQGTNPAASGTQNASSVSKRLDPGEQFAITPRATSAPSIPVNPALPEGLVFKVQIGAFRNPIPPDLFKNIQPVTGETTSSGLTRYTAGIFKKFVNADAAKNEVRALGYRDAFVVAFYNGKRISMEEALRMSGETGAVPVATQGTQTPAGSQGSNSTPAVSSQSSTPVVSSSPTVTHSPDAAKATDVKDVKGLFYTVQVGVFSLEVSSKKLYNLSGLFSEHTANGLVRYSAGKYSRLDAATASKNEIVALGIKDAFVTAYYNGKRISVAEAQELEAKGEAGGTADVDAGIPAGSGSAPATNPTRAATPASQNQTTPASSGTQSSTPKPAAQPESTSPAPKPATSQPESQSSGTQTPEAGSPVTKPAAAQPENPDSGTTAPSGRPLASTKIPVPDTGIVFSVQIGAFLDEVPLEIANQFIQLSSHGVKNYLDPSSGLTVYQVGVLSTRAEADALRAEAVSKGITDAFIVAFKDGKKISMDEALKSTGQ